MKMQGRRSGSHEMNISPYAMTLAVPERMLTVYTKTLCRACMGIAFTEWARSLGRKTVPWDERCNGKQVSCAKT